MFGIKGRDYVYFSNEYIFLEMSFYKNKMISYIIIIQKLI